MCGLFMWSNSTKNRAQKIRGLCLGLLDQETKPQMAPWSMPWFFRPLQQTTFFFVQRTWSNRLKT